MFPKIVTYLLTVPRPLIVCIFHILIIAIPIIGDFIENDPQFTKRSSDTITYITPAINILENGHFSREVSQPYLWEPYRTPGLSIIILFSIILFSSPILVLFINVIMSGVSFYFIEKLIDRIGGSNQIKNAAMIIILFLPNSLGYDGLVMTDALSGYLYVIFFYGLINICNDYPLNKYHFSILILSTFALQLLKPTFSFLPYLIITSVIITSVINKFKINWFKISGLFALSMVVPIFLSSMNYRDHKVFSVSLLGQEAISCCLLAKYISEKEDRSFLAVKKEVMISDREKSDFLKQDNLRYNKLYNYQLQNNYKIISSDPIGVLWTYTKNVIKSIFAPQEYVFYLFGLRYLAIRIIGTILQLVYIILGLIGFYYLIKNGRLSFIIVSFILIIFIILAGGLSVATAARLRFPADIMLIIPAAYGLIAAHNYYSNIRNKINGRNNSKA